MPCAQDQGRRRGEALVGADGLGQFQAASFGQFAIEDDHVERYRRRGLRQQTHGFDAVVRSDGHDAELAKGQRHDVHGQGAVVHHENMEVAESPFGLRRLVQGCPGQGGGEFEVAALAGLACDENIATHAPGQMAGDGQTQARAAKMAGRGGVGLAEGRENPGDLFSGHADAGIAYMDRKPHGPVDRGGARDTQGDRAGIREFDGIADQIDEHLAQAGGIAVELSRQRLFDVELQGEVFLPGFARKHHHDVVHHFLQVEVFLDHFELAGGSLGKIQNVVEDSQQGTGGTRDHAQVVPLSDGQMRTKQQLGRAENGMHRRADFVAHVGQEFAFGPTFVFGLLFGDGNTAQIYRHGDGKDKDLDGSADIEGVERPLRSRKYPDDLQVADEGPQDDRRERDKDRQGIFISFYIAIEIDEMTDYRERYAEKNG